MSEFLDKLLKWDLFKKLLEWISGKIEKPEEKPPEEKPPEEKPPEEKPPEEPPGDELPPDQGFVWKPISMNDKNVAVVIPAKYIFKEVVVSFGLGNRRREALKWNGTLANGQRQTWRGAHPGAYYKKNIKVTGYGNLGLTRTWIVPNGAERYDQRG